ncbi:MAG: polyprenyl synthetase family protein [Clostridia bacterium]|nr:polyprenyl synthetase family protein [Clostridia bacterium]
MDITKDIRSDLQSAEFRVSGVPGIELIERQLYEELADSKGTVREMCSHILDAGGKRIRPLLVLYSGLLFSTVSNELLKAGVAAELIHMASLVHDDIIDKSSIRRGRISINEKWDSHFAVLCGDYLFSKAFGILSKNRLMASMDLMVDSIQNMCHGEIFQAGERFNTEIGLEIYYDRISKKTAIFLENCCKVGALIGGADEERVRGLGAYGLNLGIAFQMIDDILDFCGCPEKMGKPKSEDLRQGHITMPVIFLLDDPRYGTWLRELIRQKAFDDETLDNLLKALKETGAIQRSFDIAGVHIEKAKQSLDGFPPSEYLNFLHELAELLRTRMN